jgi:hypothetical protein
MTHCEAITSTGNRCSNIRSGIEYHGHVLCGIHRKSYDVLLRTTASEAGATAAWVEQNRKNQERAPKRAQRAQARAQEREAQRREAQREANLRNEVAWVEAHARFREDAEAARARLFVLINHEEEAARELPAFHADRQNVHREEAVTLTKKVVKRVLEIPVPMEYRWGPNFVSKTPFDIGMNCQLSPHVVRTMIDKYTQDGDIYELGQGIYGRVLDGVWQYIKNSDDKEALCRILCAELTDNVGMCARGNLSRICNVLAGCVNGIGSQESVVEILGREFPLLMKLDDAERMVKAVKLLDEHNVYGKKREEWLAAVA